MPKEVAQWGYDAYGETRQWRAYDGEPLPRWHELPDGTQRAWRAAVEAVLGRSFHAPTGAVI